MIRLIRSLALSALVLAPAPAGAQQAPVLEEFTVAGIPVIHKRIEANDVIAVRLYVRGGSAALTPDKAGIENFMIAAASRGTEEYTRDEFAALAAATGTQIGGEANPDFTVATFKGIREHWDAGWDLFAQAVRHPTFPESEVELVRGQLLNQLRGRVDNPDAYLALLANQMLYAGHPYELDPLGTVETVESITVEDLRQWHARRLSRENLLIVAVGNVSRDDLAEKIADAFGDLPESGGAASAVPALEPGPAEVQVTERDLPTNYIRGQFAMPSPGDPDYAAVRVAMDILSDRLFEEIRTKRNLSYAVYAALSARQENYGLIYVTAVDPAATVPVMLAEAERLKTEPISAERLAESVNVFLTQYWLAQETHSGQAGTLGAFELVGGGWENAQAFPDRVRAVTPADIQRVARQYLKDIRFVVIGDPAAIDAALFTSL